MNNNQTIVQESDLLNDEQTCRFMKGQMTHDEEVAFMEKLKNNADLCHQAIAQARLVKGMKQVDSELKESFRQADEQTIKRIAKEASVSKKPSHVARWIAVAASFVIIVFVGFKAYDYYDTISLGKEYAKAFPISTIIRGEANTDVETELATLFNKVATCKDLVTTTSRLAVLWELSKQDTYNDYTDYAPYIGWNLAIGYLEDYEKTKAKNVLNEMKQIYPVESIMGRKVIFLLDEL